MSKFSLLSPDIYISSPTAPQTANGSTSGLLPRTVASSDKAPAPIPDPELCIIFGWMGASMKHLEKYTDTYRVLVRSNVIILLSVGLC